MAQHCKEVYLESSGVNKVTSILKLLSSELTNSWIHEGYFVDEMWIQAGGD